MATKKVPTGSKGAATPMGSLSDYPLKTDAAMNAEMRRQQAQEALHTLSRAEEHRRDKGLMRDVKKLAKQKMSHLQSLCK